MGEPNGFRICNCVRWSPHPDQPRECDCEQTCPECDGDGYVDLMDDDGFVIGPGPCPRGCEVTE